jgi:hypothetical protein
VANERYHVFGQMFIVSGTTTVAEAGRIVANTTLNLVGAGTFTLYMASGTSGTITSGTATITGSVVTLAPGLNTITNESVAGTCALAITIGTAANTNDVNSWSATDGGACTASVPASTNDFLATANTYTAGSQVTTVNATLSCLNLNFTGATNTPTFLISNGVTVAGSATFIAAMSTTGSDTSKYFYFSGASKTLTTNGLYLTTRVATINAGNPSITVVDNLSCTAIYHTRGSMTFTAGITINTTAVNDGVSSSSKTFELNDVIINCTSWGFSTASTLTLTANTSTINVSGTGAFAGGTPTGSYYDINLNGTAHTVSGTFGYNVLTRNGTATNANSVTFTSGTTITGTTTAMIGNSRANQLLVQSSTLGTAATITTTNWTGTTNVDFMDCTATNAVDFSAAGLNILTIGNAGGNTGITFPATLGTATYADTGDHKASTAANWDIGRVPLVGIDDVTIGATITDDMPRMGKSITFTGTPTVTLSLTTDVSVYGSLVSPVALGSPGATLYWVMCGRGNFVINAPLGFSNLSIQAPNGTITLQDNFVVSATRDFKIIAGTFTAGSYNVTTGTFTSSGVLTRIVNMGSGTWTIQRTGVTSTKWSITGSDLTLNAQTSTIILTGSLTNSATFAGGGLTYNNIQVAGAGAYALTVTGNNRANHFGADGQVAAKEIIATGTTQIVNSRDSAGAVTWTGGTWQILNSKGNNMLEQMMAAGLI